MTKQEIKRKDQQIKRQRKINEALKKITKSNYNKAKSKASPLGILSSAQNNLNLSTNILTVSMELENIPFVEQSSDKMQA